jgi:ABC-type branched-subunit amino acid transport system permease subunit
MGGVPRVDLNAIGIDLHDPSIFALTAILIVVVVWLALVVVMSSPFGRTLHAIRQNPDRVAALGGRV